MTQVDQNNGQQTGFNPNSHVMQLKSREGSKDYLPVQWRVVWFRERCPEGTIDTEELCVDLDREVEEEVYVWNNEKRRSEKVVKRAKGYARFKAVVTDGLGGRATGTKSENAASFPDFVEKAETGAIGRALAGLGYGTQFAPEMSEAHRIVDSPVERSTPHSDGVQGEVSHPLANATAGEVVTSSMNLSDIPSVKKLRETAQTLSLEWDSVLAGAFERFIAEGKVTLEALKNKGSELPPDYCKRIAIYLQSRAA